METKRSEQGLPEQEKKENRLAPEQVSGTSKRRTEMLTSGPGLGKNVDLDHSGD